MIGRSIDAPYEKEGDCIFTINIPTLMRTSAHDKCYERKHEVSISNIMIIITMLETWGIFIVASPIIIIMYYSIYMRAHTITQSNIVFSSMVRWLYQIRYAFIQINASVFTINNL